MSLPWDEAIVAMAAWMALDTQGAIYTARGHW
jgi:hypothetical protein